MGRIILLFCVFICMNVYANAQSIDQSLLQGYDAALVINNRKTGQQVDINPVCSVERLAPCSTFKIYNTLIGLQLGLIKSADEPWYQWDGIKRDIEAWNQDLTLREAFRVSAVPAFQILARQIGEVRMKSLIDTIDYGSKDISAGIDIFWLPRPGTKSIAISAQEQVNLLMKLLDGELPFFLMNISILRDVMQIEKSQVGTLYGKTGSGTGPDGQWNLGWFVGFLEHGDSTYVFACNIKGGENPSGKTARKIVTDIFKSQGLL